MNLQIQYVLKNEEKTKDTHVTMQSCMSRLIELSHFYPQKVSFCLYASDWTN